MPGGRDLIRRGPGVAGTVAAVRTAVRDRSATRSCLPGLMMLISSPPCGPFSLSQISPVSGWTIRPMALRMPSAKISGLYPVRPANGLSAGARPIVVQPQDLAEMAGRDPAHR